MTDPGTPLGPEPAPASVGGVPWERLETQIEWYDRKSGQAQHLYKRAKVAELMVAASVPPLAGLRAPVAVVSILASIVVVLEGLQHLFQWNEHWIAYRSTCEALKHDRYLYLARAGPYAVSPDPHVLLAERVEGLVSQEHAKWASSTQQQTQGTGAGAGGGSA
jgi:hypothetical protein